MRPMTFADWIELGTVAFGQGLLSPYTLAAVLIAAVLAGLVDQLRRRPRQPVSIDQPNREDPT